jgi:hypothetical protein
VLQKPKRARPFDRTRFGVLGVVMGVGQTFVSAGGAGWLRSPEGKACHTLTTVVIRLVRTIDGHADGIGLGRW